MSQSRRAKKERSRERERARSRFKALRNGLIALAVAGAIGAVIVLGVVAGSGGGNGGGGSTSAGSHELAPDVQISTTSWSGGRTFRLSELRGKPVALYFVAAWCSTCIPETRAWAKIYPEIKEQAEVIIFDIDTNEDENDLLRFKRQAGGADHLWAMDVGNQVARAFDIPVLDATVIIDADGKIAYRDFSPTSEGKLREVLAKLLEVKAGPESNVP
jgi:peroxiredoxin